MIALSDISVATVRDSRGSEVGEVVDLLLDPNATRIAYIIIRLFRDNGEYPVPVTIPWSAISIVPEEIPQLRVAVRGSTLRKLAAQ